MEEKKMPELPEVETLCRQLGNAIVGKILIKTQSLDEKLYHFSELEQHKVTSVSRRGKNLLWFFDDGYVLTVHLRMTGRLLWQKENGDPPKYTRFIMTFPQGRIFFIDPRRFMTLTWERTFPAQCGPEPFPHLDPAYLSDRGKNRKGPIKSFLLDQAMIAGIGNIYACEILHLAGIAPVRPVCSLDGQQWQRLLSAIDDVLNKAVNCRGTSISDWRDFHGQKGTFQNELHVYGRDGLPCLRCGAAVVRCSLGGRGTYFCPGCQT